MISIHVHLIILVCHFLYGPKYKPIDLCICMHLKLFLSCSEHHAYFNAEGDSIVSKESVMHYNHPNEKVTVGVFEKRKTVVC